MTPKKDYTTKSWIAAAALVVLLLAVSFIPPQTIGEISLRRTNILSDLMSFDDVPATASSATFDESEFDIDMKQVEALVADTMPEASLQTVYQWDVGNGRGADYGEVTPVSTRIYERLTPIEDFAEGNESPMKAFFRKLRLHDQPVRIAFMGDSFIEGDILSADLREKLQSAYGGCGSGFAPVASPLTGFRQTVKTQSRNWNTYNIMQRRSTPEALKESYFISGWVSRPTRGAYTRWEGTSYRRNIDSCSKARIVFISRENSVVEVSVNDRQSKTFDIEGGTALREIEITGDLRSVSIKVLSGESGFVGYGAVFEGDGVVLDNYSIRSNNGQAMFWTNPAVNFQFNSMHGYDLIILQYGLNIMQSGVHSYANYAKQIKKMIYFVSECFPTAAIMVMSVSDRSVKSEAGFAAMDAIPYMVSAQREAARQAGVAFWSTYDAMKKLGGMSEFVANGWAGKDYTHINFAGGRRVAYSLFDAINDAVLKEAAEKPMAKKIEMPFTKVIDDSMLDSTGTVIIPAEPRIILK